MRFKFSGSWKECSLSSIVTRIKRKNIENISNLPLTISAQYGLIDQESFFGKKVASSNLENYYLLFKGDFAYNKSYSKDYPWGAIKRLDLYDCGVVSNLYICFLPNQSIESDYLVHYFESDKWYKQISDIAGEGARNHGLLNMSIDDFFRTKHYLPSYDEQLKIGHFLNLIKERIETQNKIIEEYQTLKNCIFDYIILNSRKIGTCKINKIIEEYSVKTTIDNEYPVLSSTASGIYFQNEYFNKEAASENTTGYKCVPKGYCTYRSMSDTGRFYFNIQSITDVGIVSPAYPVFSVKEDSALFLVNVLNSDKTIINEILKLKAGGTRFSLPFKKLVELEVPWPDYQTRKHFMKMIKNMIQKIDLEQKILAKYIDQKNYLLNNMFI